MKIKKEETIDRSSKKKNNYERFLKRRKTNILSIYK